MLESYTSQQRVKVIKMYNRNSDSVALRALRPIYGRNNRARNRNRNWPRTPMSVGSNPSAAVDCLP